METQTTAAEATPTENSTPAAAPASTGPKNPGLGVHAVVRDKTTGETTVVMKTSKKELSKYLGSLPSPDLELLYIFKGKQLQLKAKQTYSFQ